jgi:hypothetical protein
VKRNLCKEHVEYGHDVAQAECVITYEDASKTVYTIHTGKKHAGDTSALKKQKKEYSHVLCCLSAEFRK